MNEQETTTRNEEPRATTGEAWEEVGRQFQTLGESIAAAFRTAWQDEKNRQRAQEMQAGLEAMVKDVSQAIRETAGSQRVEEARVKTVESFRVAGEQTVQELRPHLQNALREVNEALESLIGRMEQEKKAQSGPSAYSDQEAGTPPRAH